MNPTQILTDDVIHIIEGVAGAITTGSGKVTLDPVEVNVAGRALTLTPTIDIAVKSA